MINNTFQDIYCLELIYVYADTLINTFSCNNNKFTVMLNIRILTSNIR